MSSYKKLVLSFSLILVIAAAVLAQKTSSIAALPAQTSEAQVFTSAAEKFSIRMPPKPTVARDIKAGEMFGVASGRQYTWALQEGSVSVALAVFDEPMRGTADFLSFAEGMKESVEKGNAGKITSEKVDKTGAYRFIEYFFTVPDGHVTMSRWYVSNTQYYNVMVVLKKDVAADKESAVKVLDSFKILDETAALRKRNLK